MFKISFAIAAAAGLALLSPNVAGACPGSAEASGSCGSHAKKAEGTSCHGPKVASSVQDISVDALAALTKAKANVTVLDANNAKTRAEQGIIPGAVLLSSVSAYDVSVLPAAKDQKLVFYCANERCSASTTAAKRALEAGYQDVSILPAGISGWKAGGQPTQTQPRS